MGTSPLPGSPEPVSTVWPHPRGLRKLPCSCPRWQIQHCSWYMVLLTWKLENGDTILGSDCRLGDPAVAACARSPEGAAAGAGERECAVTSAGLCPS